VYSHVVMELYEDKAAIAVHGASTQFKVASAKFDDLLAGAPNITNMEVIG
jgi:quinol monooxygenase YgiN